ncbi:MAG: hypothetical protein HY866_21545 [Chloroflexi bacterium]|nr:hypothetical protein [Chloroflexota bacterium]
MGSLVTRVRWIIAAAAVMLLLAGCRNAQNNDPVFVVATPVPPDAGYVTYQHSSGVFTLRIPPDWIANELPDPNGARVQFTSLESEKAVTRLSVYVVNTGQPMTPEGFAAAVSAYQPPADVADLEWQEISRADQRDGSRRLAGVRNYPMLGPRSLNIFLQGDGAFFSALEIDVTDIPTEKIETVMAVINTYRINRDANLTVGKIAQAAAGVTSSSGVIGFHGYMAWTDRSGVFHLTGEAVNTTPNSLEAVRLSGVLYDLQERRLDEQSDILSMDVLGPGQGAPFDLRFEGGKPPAAVRYELNIAGRAADYALQTFYGPDNFTVLNDQANYTGQGYLIVSGQLANTGPSIAEAVKVIVAVWDDQGRVVAVETVFLPNPQLVPQEAANFEVPFYELGGSAVTYTLAVTGTVAGTEAGG